MFRLPVPATEPRPSGGAAGAARAGERPSWASQKVKVPRRVWAGGYSAGAVAYWAQIAALAQRPEGCRAGVTTLAGYLGDAKRTAERYLAELSAPGPAGGEPELTTVRHTAADGDGETAERRTRPVLRGEHFALVPVAAAKALRHPLFAAFCALAYAVATKTPVTAAELAALLGVTEMTARRMTNELDRLGWITVHRRAGAHGRHLYEVHDHPLQLVTDGPSEPNTDGGSAASGNGGSLASKEDAGLTDAEKTGVGGSFRRRRGDRKWVATPVDTASNIITAGNPEGVPGTFRPAAPTRPYDGPQLTLSPRVWAVLEPVHDLLPGVREFVMRRLAREVGAQLDAGVLPEDLAEQLRRVRAWTPAEEIRDTGRWLLAAAMPLRHGGCGTADCIGGYQRHTGARCKACEELYGDRVRPHAPHAPPARPGAPPRPFQPLLDCPGCSAPYRPPARHPCRLCGTELPTGT